MASEKEANRARAEHSEFLKNLGAHSIGIEEIKLKGAKGFAVVAFFDRKPEKGIPQSLNIKIGNRRLAVPLIAALMKMPSIE
jgi:hypothetical protein